MEELKGFIEVTSNTNKKVLLNLISIKCIGGDTILLDNNDEIEVKESYEEIKQLIKNAQ